MSDKKFNYKSIDSWKEVLTLIGVNLGNIPEEALKFIGNIPSMGILLVTEYRKLRTIELTSDSLEKKLKLE